MQPLCVDLFCGDGGWTDGFLSAGYRVVGFDLVRRRAYRGELVLQDVRTLDGWRFAGARAIVASPPCNDFSTANPKRQPTRGMELVEAAVRVIVQAAPRYWVIENVRGSLPYLEPLLGPWRLRLGGRNAAHYLWGRFPRFMMMKSGPWEKGKHRSPWLRARMPFEVAYPLALACLPHSDALLPGGGPGLQVKGRA